MSTYSNFPDDKEAEDRRLLPLSYEYYSENPVGYNNCIIDFIGILIKSMNDSDIKSMDVKYLQDMKERFKRDK